MSTQFVAMIEEIGNYFEENCADDRKRALASKKRKYANLKKNMQVAQVILAAELATEKQLKDWLQWDCQNFEITKENAHKIRQVFGDYELTNTKQLKSAENRTVKVYVKFGEHYTGPEWYIVTTLPEDAKCKIVEQTSSYKTLVCDVE